MEVTRGAETTLSRGYSIVFNHPKRLVSVAIWGCFLKAECRAGEMLDVPNRQPGDTVVFNFSTTGSTGEYEG